MGDADTAMQRWCDGALVVIQSLLDAAVPADGGTAEAGDELVRSMDTLLDAVRHADRWTTMHPCPDPQLGEELAHLVATWAAIVTGDGAEPPPNGATPAIAKEERHRRISAVSDDTVRLQATLDAELLPGH